MEYAETGDFPRSLKGAPFQFNISATTTTARVHLTSIVLYPYPKHQDGKEEGSQTYETLTPIETYQ